MAYNMSDREVVVKGLNVALFIALCICDTALTLTGVTINGTSSEANPFMRWLLEAHIGWFVLYKVGTLLFLAVMAEHIKTWMWVALNIIMFPTVLLWAYLLFWL